MNKENSVMGLELSVVGLYRHTHHWIYTSWNHKLYGYGECGERIVMLPISTFRNRITIYSIYGGIK